MKITPIGFETYNKQINNKYIKKVQNNNKLNFCATPFISDRIITLEDQNGQTKQIVLRSTTIKKYLCDKKGDVDEKLVDKFIEIYKNRVNSQRSQILKTQDNLNKTINDEEINKIVSINKNKDVIDAFLASMFQGDIFGTSFVENIKDGSQKKEFATKILSTEHELLDNLYTNCYEDTEKLFYMCTIDYEYDFSNLDKKFEFISSVNNLQKACPKSGPIYEKIVDSANRNLGFDLDYARYILSIARTIALGPKSIDYLIELVNKFVSKDPQNEDLILSSMYDMAKPYPIDDKDECFEKAFGYCYNPLTQKFDIERYDLLRKLLSKTQVHLDIEKEDLDSELHEFNLWEKDIIKNYFDTNTNRTTGDLKKEIIDPADFILCNLRDDFE